MITVKETCRCSASVEFQGLASSDIASNLLTQWREEHKHSMTLLPFPGGPEHTITTITESTNGPVTDDDFACDSGNREDDDDDDYFVEGIDNG